MERLHKVLARAGVASRRKCEDLIAAGRVQVNGRTVTDLGSKVNPDRDLITVDGEPITVPGRCAYLLVNKPAGCVSTVHDPQGRPTVMDLVPARERLYPVGRLDMDSEGLLLLTNDGELTQRLTHPSYEHEKEYHVWVDGKPTRRTLQRLREGIELEDGFTWPAEVAFLRRQSGGTWLRFVIHEGRKRQLRRMCQSVGHPVRRLIRMRMGPLRLGDLEPGQHRPLTKHEQELLRRAVGLNETQTEASEVQLPYPDTIAIDGPASAGKSTIGRLLAQELGYLYFDTGVMYRAVTLAALQRGIEIADEGQVTELANQVRIDVSLPTIEDGRQYTVCVDAEDVTWDLRLPEVDQNVSPVSAYAGVRAALTKQQRRIGQQGNVVMVGRDIGTVVLPDAQLKIYLDAAVETRAKRRYLENTQRGQQCRYEDILRDMCRRDKIDSERDAAPLRPADDAVLIDSTELTIAEVMQLIRPLMEEADQ